MLKGNVINSEKRNKRKNDNLNFHIHNIINNKKVNKHYRRNFMKEYSKPMLALIEFDAKDVLAVSAAGFDISWLNVIPSGQEELE